MHNLFGKTCEAVVVFILLWLAYRSIADVIRGIRFGKILLGSNARVFLRGNPLYFVLILVGWSFAGVLFATMAVFLTASIFRK